MKDNKRLKRCVGYFRNNVAFARIFAKMKQKYKSLGKIGGKIVIRNLSRQEQETLTGYFRKDYSHQKQATIKLEKFEKALQGTRFDGLLLEDILKEYFADEEIISNKKERNIYLTKRENFFREIIAEFKGTSAGAWLNEAIFKGNNAYSIFMKKYNYDQEKLKMDIYYVARALNRMPLINEDKKRLAMFASQITKNPHAFDQGTNCGTLLQYGLMYLLNTKKPNNAEERAELFYNAGILINEVVNYTLCCGLEAYIDGQTHPGWRGFRTNREAILVSLKNLSNLDRIISPVGKVFVFENPAVFSTILDRLPSYNLPLVCTNGQLRLASLLLLDKLKNEETVIYYSGDFDPEGLGIADRLKSRYNKYLKLWRYSTNDYEKTISKKKINSTRMKKLDNLKNKELIDTGKSIKKYGVAGYQELLIDELLDDIRGLAMGI